MHAYLSEMAALDGPLDECRRRYRAKVAAAAGPSVEEAAIEAMENFDHNRFDEFDPPSFNMMYKASKDTVSGLRFPDKSILERIRVHVEGLFRALEDADLPGETMLDIGELLSVQYKLFELNYDILKAKAAGLENEISPHALKRLEAYNRMTNKLNNDSQNVMMDLIPPPDEPVYADTIVPLVLDGFTFYVDRNELSRFMEIPFSEEAAPKGKVLVHTIDGNIYVDPEQAEIYYLDHDDVIQE